MIQHESLNSWSDEQKWAYLVRHERLGEVLVRHGQLKLAQLEIALKEQEKSQPPKHIGEIIVDKKLLTLDEIVAALDNQKQNHLTNEQSISKLKKRDKN